MRRQTESFMNQRFKTCCFSPKCFQRCLWNVDSAVGLILDINLPPLETEAERDNQRRARITNRIPEERKDRATVYNLEQASTSRMTPWKRLMDWWAGGNSRTDDANQNKTSSFVNRDANLHLPSTSTSQSQHIFPSPRANLQLPSTSTSQSQHIFPSLRGSLQLPSTSTSQSQHIFPSPRATLAADWVDDCSDEEDTIPLKLDSESLECLLTLFGETAFPVPDGAFPTVDLPVSLARQIGAGGHAMEVDDEEMVDLNLDPEFCRQLRNLTGSRMGCNDDRSVAVDLPVSLARQIYVYLIESQQQQVERHEAHYERILRDAEFAHRLLEADLSMATFQETQSAPPADVYNPSQEDAEKMTEIRKLINMFPNFNQGWLIDVFEANGESFDYTVEILQKMPTACSKETLPTPEVLLELEKKKIEEATKEIMKLHEMRDMTSRDTVKDRAMSEANYYREEVRILNNLRDDFFQRMTSTASSMDTLACAQVAQHYRERVEEANARAAAAIMAANASGRSLTTLDLHCLRVKEALVVLELFLDDHAARLSDSGEDSVKLFLIVGRGIHSVGGKARVKPAVQAWLKRVRGMDYVMVNPGMLRVVVMRIEG